MKNLLIIALLAVSATCQNQAGITAANPLVEAEARVVGNQLPVDGCDAHIWLNIGSTSSASSTYMRLPTAATRSLLDNVIKAESDKQPAGTLWMGTKDVTIRYRETDQTATLLCGWNAKQELKTIELLEIKAR
ncbi:hypothetical protein [Fibrella arboris]|uniref:hypothetical protein n=1 Tax=Fibrella arboris TaxID=3242486 RepID=UPI00352246B3